MGDDLNAGHLAHGYAVTVTNATQTVFAGHRAPGSLLGRRLAAVTRARRLLQGDAEVDVDLPASNVDPFDEEAHEALALGEVEGVEGGRNPGGEAVDALAKLVAGRELLALGTQRLAA